MYTLHDNTHPFRRYLQPITAQRLVARTMLNNQTYGDMNDRRERVIYIATPKIKVRLKKMKY